MEPRTQVRTICKNLTSFPNMQHCLSVLQQLQHLQSALSDDSFSDFGRTMSHLSLDPVLLQPEGNEAEVQCTWQQIAKKRALPPSFSFRAGR